VNYVNKEVESPVSTGHAGDGRALDSGEAREESVRLSSTPKGKDSVA